MQWNWFLIEKSQLFDWLRGQMNARAEKAMLRMFREGSHGFERGPSAVNYRSNAGETLTTRSRDLTGLVAKGALTKKGERRYARYRLAVASTK